nr:MAG TPA: hypothetical protein [Caudoviricetes sp.]
MFRIKIHKSRLIQIGSFIPVVSKHYSVSRNELYTFSFLNKRYCTEFILLSCYAYTE